MKTLLSLLLLCLIPPALAHDEYKPVPVQQSQDSDRHTANFLGSAVVSAIATDTLKDSKYGAVKAFTGTVVAAAIIESAQNRSYNGSNLGYAVLGATVGTVGVCAVYLKKNFVGCGMPF